MPKVNARLPVLVGTIEKQIKDYKILFIGAMFPEKIQFDGKKYRTNYSPFGLMSSHCMLGSYNKVLEWIFENTKELQKEKTEDRDDKSLSSVSVPQTGLFYEPFMRDLELLCSLRCRQSVE